MIVDTHTHYSEPHSAERPYDPALIANDPWLTVSKRLAVEDLVAAASQAGVDKVIQVTNTKMGYDNRYSLEGAARYPERILGVIGRFDPFAPEMENRLRAYIAQPYMLGIRFTLLAERNKSWLKDRTLDRFFAAAQKLDVAVAIYAPYQIAEMQETARRFPGIRFLIDHMGQENGPPPRASDEIFANWADVLKFASEPNVWMKVSFFPEAAYFSERYPFPAAQKRFRELYECVGASRLIWGSNFPPVKNVGACTYQEALDFVRVHCDFLSAVDRDAILGGNFLARFTKEPQ